MYCESFKAMWELADMISSAFKKARQDPENKLYHVRNAQEILKILYDDTNETIESISRNRFETKEVEIDLVLYDAIGEYDDNPNCVCCDLVPPSCGSRCNEIGCLFFKRKDAE